MKIYLFFLGSILCYFTNCAFAQNDTDIVRNQRETVYQNYVLVKSSITDSTIRIMKELANAQDKVINVDNSIINDYLPLRESKIKENEKKIKCIENNNKKLNTVIKENELLFFYFCIGGGALFLLFVIFLVLYIIQISKTKKTKSKKIDKLKLEQQKEIDVIKKDVEKQKEKLNKEIQVLSDKFEKDFIAIKTQNTELILDKSRIESQLREKLLLETTFENEKQILQNEIEFKNNQIEQLQQEKNTNSNTYKESNELLDEKERQRKLLEEEIKNITTSFNEKLLQQEKYHSDYDNLLSEKNNIEKELLELRELLSKELQIRKQTEEDLRNFLDELKHR